VSGVVLLLRLRPDLGGKGRAGRRRIDPESIRYGGSGPFRWVFWGRFWVGGRFGFLGGADTGRRDLCGRCGRVKVRSGSICGTVGEFRAMPPLDSRLITCSPLSILESLCLLRFLWVSLLFSGYNFEKMCCFLISAVALMLSSSFNFNFFVESTVGKDIICFLCKFRISKLRVFVTRQLLQAMVIPLLLFADSTIKISASY
jgi:hypothetical protein